MIFILDNLDSFTYNLVHLFAQLGATVNVKRNNEITLDEIIALKPRVIVLSAGAGKPRNAGIMMDLIAAVAGKIPLLGICLGHQAIGEYFGMKLINAKEIMHGKISEVTHNGRGLFKNLPENLKVVRYHSLALSGDFIPDDLEISATNIDDGEIMAINHKKHLIAGLQYHPESILTNSGKLTMGNFLEMVNQ